MRVPSSKSPFAITAAQHVVVNCAVTAGTAAKSALYAPSVHVCEALDKDEHVWQQVFSKSAVVVPVALYALSYCPLEHVCVAETDAHELQHVLAKLAAATS
jgi:hypothetical protein